MYSMAECTFPAVASKARTFCDAFVKPISFNCCTNTRSDTWEATVRGIILLVIAPGISPQEVVCPLEEQLLRFHQMENQHPQVMRRPCLHQGRTLRQMAPSLAPVVRRPWD